MMERGPHVWRIEGEWRAQRGEEGWMKERGGEGSMGERWGGDGGELRQGRGDEGMVGGMMEGLWRVKGEEILKWWGVFFICTQGKGRRGEGEREREREGDTHTHFSHLQPSPAICSLSWQKRREAQEVRGKRDERGKREKGEGGEREENKEKGREREIK
jgi:hypothetical protein